jgi:eukaryotic-like serine/threonine-protein kinase
MSLIAPGLLVSPNVRLVRALSQGGMGTVWVAEHLSLGTDVAVKFISPDLAAKEPTLVMRFQREARAAARIRDPHIVQILDHGATQDGTPFIVMELLHGESLAQRLSRGPLAPEELCAVVSQAAGALAKAHALGVVHRDIKPENLFFTDAAGGLFVKLLDFGIAKQADAPGDRMTATSAVFGTPGYMSPEQLLSTRDVDAGADLWALAVTAYEALTGHLPFDGATPAAVAVAVCAGQFAPAGSIRADLPPALDAWFARALARDPARRFGDAGEFARAFLLASVGQCDTDAPTAPRAADRDHWSDGPTTKLQARGSVGAASREDHGSLIGSSSTLSPHRTRRARRLIAAVAAAGAAVLVVVAGIALWPRSPTSAGTAPAARQTAGAQEGRESGDANAAAGMSAEPSAPGAEPATAVGSATASAAPATSETARTGHRARSSSSSAPSGTPTSTPDCSVPFYVDEQGIKRVRRECF